MRVNFAKVSAVRSVFVAALAFCCCFGATIDDQDFNGRWDITVSGPAPQRGWWLEVAAAGTEGLRGRFMGAPVGLLDDIPKLSISEGALRFALEGKFRKEHGLEKGLYWARLEDGKLKGTFEIEGDPATYLEWTGVRAPALADKDDSSWKRGDPVFLFDGRDVAGWQTLAPGHAGAWVVKDGVLTALPGAPDLVSDKKFFDFVLDAEFKIDPHTNSGIALRGRYEVQIADDLDKPLSNRTTGAIVGRIAPTRNAAKAPEEWQTLAVRLVGREVTVVLNGIRVINRQTIDGPTSIALDTNEADPGPILLEGSRGSVEFRRLVVYPLAKKP
jgi:hypothetical protein